METKSDIQTKNDIQEDVYKDYLLKKEEKKWIGIFLIASIVSCFLFKLNQPPPVWDLRLLGKIWMIGIGFGYCVLSTCFLLFVRVNVYKARNKLERKISELEDKIDNFGPQDRIRDKKELLRCVKLRQKMYKLEAELKMIGG